MQEAMAYRVTFLISIMGGLVQVCILYYIWKVVYSGNHLINDFSFHQIVTYIFISYAIKNLYSFYTEISISSKIRDGSIAMELIKPLNYQVARFFESLGKVAVEGIIVCSLVLIIGFGIFRINLPISFSLGVAFFFSVILSIILNFIMSFLISLCAFWTTSVFGIVNSKRFIIDFFSGALVPLAFFPEWLKHIAEWLPFQALVYIPLSIYQGKVTGETIFLALLKQIIWLAVLFCVASLVWKYAARKLIINGG